MVVQEGAQSDSIHGYALPVCNVEDERRNFPGLKKKTYMSLAEMQDMNKATNTTADE